MTRLIHTANGAKVSSPVDRHLMVPLVTGDPSRILSLVGHFSPGKYLRATNLSRTEILFCFVFFIECNQKEVLGGVQSDAC